MNLAAEIELRRKRSAIIRAAMKSTLDLLVAKAKTPEEIGRRTMCLALALGCRSLGLRTQKELAVAFGFSKQRASAAVDSWRAKALETLSTINGAVDSSGNGET